MPSLTRRGALLGGLSLAAGAACGRPAEPATAPDGQGSPPEGAALAAPAPVPADPVTVTRVRSAARDTEVDVVLMRPEGVPPGPLPVCVALHGRGGSARGLLRMELPRLLTEAVRDGAPPFAIAAVDGAHYWVATKSDDDPQRMLDAELPSWLDDWGYAAPVAALGFSMGGFGALRFARDHRDLRAVAVCSPALFVNWPDAKARKVFRDRAQWQAHEPLRHVDALAGIPLGVWCGTGDPFIKATRRLVGQAAPSVAELEPGGHTGRYWRGVLPSIVRFLGEEIG